MEKFCKNLQLHDGKQRRRFRRQVMAAVFFISGRFYVFSGELKKL